MATQLLLCLSMNAKQIVLCGALGGDRVCWESLGEEFGLDFFRASTVAALSDVNDLTGVHAVLVEVDDHREAIEAGLSEVRAILPDARILACHGMRCRLEAQDFDAFGAFHTLVRPLDPQEVRQALGFLWEALRREDLERLPVQAPPRRQPFPLHERQIVPIC